MLLWEILAVFAIILSILCYVFRKILILKDMKCIKSYVGDNLVTTKREYGSENSYYSKSGEDKDIVCRYVIRKTNYETSVILNYTSEFKNVELYITCFNKKGKIIDILKIKETNTSINSKIYVLNKQTEYINVVVKNCNDVDYNLHYIRPEKMINLLGEQALTAVSIFCLLFASTIIGSVFVIPDTYMYYVTSDISHITFLAMLLISIIILIVTTISRKAKSKK